MIDYEILRQKIIELVSMIEDAPEDWEESSWQRHVAFRYYPDQDSIEIAFITEINYSGEGCAILTLEESSKDKAGYVYVLRADNGYYKVGRTKNLDSRMYQLEVALPYDLELVCAIEVKDYITTEKALHDLFTDAGKHIKGEWFELGETDIEYIKSIGEQDD